MSKYFVLEFGLNRLTVIMAMLVHALLIQASAQESQDNPQGLSTTRTQQVDAAKIAKSTATSGQDKKATSEIDLLSADLTKNWKAFSSKSDTTFSDVWKLVNVENERHLICVGDPKGFLFTQEQYENFELTFEWKYTTDANGNSGVLVFTQDEPRLWPTSMQIQLHQPRAGCIFPSGDAKSVNTTEATDLALAIGKWNTCKVIAQGGRLAVEINGKPAGEVSGCNPAKGSIALQSEGSETHFRRMLVRKLPVPTQSAEATLDNTATPGKKQPSDRG